jgi:hypothetical protein
MCSVLQFYFSTVYCHEWLKMSHNVWNSSSAVRLINSRSMAITNAVRFYSRGVQTEIRKWTLAVKLPPVSRQKSGSEHWLLNCLRCPDRNPEVNTGCQIASGVQTEIRKWTLAVKLPPVSRQKSGSGLWLSYCLRCPDRNLEVDSDCHIAFGVQTEIWKWTLTVILPPVSRQKSGTRHWLSNCLRCLVRNFTQDIGFAVTSGA